MVWEHPSKTVANAAAEAELARQMHGAWCAFLRGETPAAIGLPEWPRYTPEERRTMIFDVQSQVKAQPQESELRLWDGVFKGRSIYG